LKVDDAPRYLLSFDGATGRELWRFCLGPQSLELACDDFDDNIPLVVFTTFAVSNGVSCNGTSDSCSYVFCLDSRSGGLIWRKRVAGWAGRGDLVLEDIDGDGRNEIIVVRYVARNDTTVHDPSHAWTVAAMSSEGEILSSVPLPTRSESICSADLDGDSSPEFIIDGSDGRIALLNHDLTLRRIIEPPVSIAYAKFRMLGVWDMAGCGKPNLVCKLDSMLIVRDQKGRIIAERAFTRLFEAQLASYDGRNYIAVESGDSIHVMAMRKLPLATRLRSHSRGLTIGAGAAVLIGGWSVYGIRRHLRRRREGRIDYYEAQNELLTAMSAFGHGGSSLKILDRLRFHLKNWERIRPDGVTREQLFGRLHETYKETVLPELEHLVVLARRAGVPDGIWGTLRAEAELASREMEGVLAYGSQETSQENGRIVKALDALDAVDESIAGIRAHLRSVFRVPVAEGLDRLIMRFRNEHGARGISFALISDSSSGDYVFISPISFDKIIEVLLSNAVRATEWTAGAEITVMFQWEGNYCRIDVRDNGCGIQREDWERIFERHYTTKAEGGGFGLHYAREELAKFGGKIYVLDSIAGQGTTMRIVLRKSEKAGTA
jgi:signal transduction histidine kinase